MILSASADTMASPDVSADTRPSSPEASESDDEQHVSYSEINQRRRAQNAQFEALLVLNMDSQTSS